MKENEESRILVVDDEEKMRDMIRDYLEAVGFSVTSAQNGKEALEAAETEMPDLIVLDIMMPGLDGFDTTRRLRKESHIPVIMLTARAEEADKLMGLEVGADDYMVKPFSLKELAARIRAVLRRTAGTTSGGGKTAHRGASKVYADSSGGENVHKDGETNSIRIGDLLINPEKRKVELKEKKVELTGVQFDLLLHMAEHPGRVFTRMQLLEALQDHAFEGYERTVDVHIKNIRKALEYDPSKPVYIKTVWGVGYKMEEEHFTEGGRKDGSTS